MKKIYFLLLTILMTSFTFGQVLTENFDYGTTAGDLTTASGGAWVQHSGSTAPVAYVAAPTSLTMTSYPASGVGGHATYSGTSQDVNRTFAAISTGTVYASALVNLSAVGSGNYFMHLNTGGFRSRVGAKDDGNGDILFGIGASSSTLTYGTTPYSLNTTYLLVFSYEIATGVSKLHVLSAVTTTEPGTPEATNTGSTGTAINAIAFRQSSNIPAVAIDGIRVGTSWSEILVSTLSVDSLEATNFSIFPNPTNTGFVNITTTTDAPVNVRVYDITGKKVISETLSNKTLNVSNLKPGIYSLILNQNKTTVTKKIVIK
ncbi:MAG: T9SS type A sorting domain-containing protein [Oceanihabitans sp.]|nr:T9SS type A sorting domain-containing protein [Oceanihabitans sp.]